MKLDLAALREKLREYDKTVPRCEITCQIEVNWGDFSGYETMTCCRPEGHEGECRNTRLVLGWPGFQTLRELIRLAEIATTTQGETMKDEHKQRVGAIVDRILDAADEGIDQHRDELSAVLAIIAPRLDERAALAAAERVIDAVVTARNKGDERGRRRRMRLAAFRAVLGVVIEAVT